MQRFGYPISIERLAVVDAIENETDDLPSPERDFFVFLVRDDESLAMIADRLGIERRILRRRYRVFLRDMRRALAT